MIRWQVETPISPPAEEATVDAVDLRLLPSTGDDDPWLLVAHVNVGHVPEVEDDEVRVTRRFTDRPTDAKAQLVAHAARMAALVLEAERVTPTMAAVLCYERHARNGRTLTADELRKLAEGAHVSIEVAEAVIAAIHAEVPPF